MVLFTLLTTERSDKFDEVIIAQAPKEVEYAKYEDRNLLMVLNSEKLADYNSECCQEVRWSIYFLYPPPLYIK